MHWKSSTQCILSSTLSLNESYDTPITCSYRCATESFDYHPFWILLHLLDDKKWQEQNYEMRGKMTLQTFFLIKIITKMNQQRSGPNDLEGKVMNPFN